MPPIYLSIFFFSEVFAGTAMLRIRLSCWRYEFEGAPGADGTSGVGGRKFE